MALKCDSFTRLELPNGDSTWENLSNAAFGLAVMGGVPGDQPDGTNR
jgi:hypothetical protein